jgi:hypothetical protein
MHFYPHELEILFVALQGVGGNPAGPRGVIDKTCDEIIRQLGNPDPDMLDRKYPIYSQPFEGVYFAGPDDPDDFPSTYKHIIGKEPDSERSAELPKLGGGGGSSNRMGHLDPSVIPVGEVQAASTIQGAYSHSEADSGSPGHEYTRWSG